MSTPIIPCEQAIFTSVRTPMGEGYRIIAASPGLKPEEKQTITRFSPSHEALCPVESNEKRPDGVCGVAFYPLPTKRVCVACSCDAGAEHTGRGGMRVYTHNVVFDAADLEQCKFNPFAVVRAMAEIGLTVPQLKPPAVLPNLELPLSDAVERGPSAALDDHVPTPWRLHALEGLLAERSLIVNVPGEWLAIAEALILGVPGPLRTRVSFAAGMKFSVNRCHHLSLLADEQHHARSRVTGQKIEYLEPGADEPPRPPDGAWHRFVERHWGRGDVTGLAHRTSRPFADVRPEGRERVGQLYNEIDDVPRTDTNVLLDNVMRRVGACQDDEVEAGILTELEVATQRELVNRFDKMSWDEAQPLWARLVELRRKSEESRLFATPLIDSALAIAERKHPTVAA
ncbi:MAG: hypothetical protein PVI86_17935, partial [Phycisphaerae bacterium]